MAFLIHLFSLLVTLVAVVWSLLAAALVLAGSERARDAVSWTASIPRWLVGGALALALTERLIWTDWVHLYWSAQVPLVALLLCSGGLLCRTWERQGPWPARAPWVLLALVAALALAPLVLQLLIPETRPHPRASGTPVRRLLELGSWGLGEVLPAWLAPGTPLEVARGVGHLPREVTVPMGALLVGAWVWIGYVALALATGLLPWRRARVAAGLVAPLALGVGVLVFDQVSPLGVLDTWWGPVETGFFGASRDDGIWRSDPAVLLSFGPTMVAAGVAALVLLGAQVVHGTRAVQRSAKARGELRWVGGR